MPQERSTSFMNDAAVNHSATTRCKRQRTGDFKPYLSDKSTQFWHYARADRIVQLRECLPPASETCDFATVLENVLVVKRFSDADSNKYSDAFAAYCRNESVPASHSKKRRVDASWKRTDKSFPFAMKAIPFASYEESAYVYRDEPLSHAALRYSTWVERAIMLICNELIAAKCTPSLPYLVRSYVCSQPFSPFACLQKQKEGALVLCSEWAQGGNMLQWAVSRARHPVKQWHCIMFHIFVALYALQKYCNVTHHDLHMENVLLLSIESAANDNNINNSDNGGGVNQHYWQYRVDGEMYYVPECLGFVPVLWDFGIAHRPHFITNRSFRYVYEECAHNRRCADAENLLTIVSEMRDNGDISFPSTSWTPYRTVLSWNQWSLKRAIPFIFKRHFRKKPRNNAVLLEPCYDVTRDRIVPQNKQLAKFFCQPATSCLSGRRDMQSKGHKSTSTDEHSVTAADDNCVGITTPADTYKQNQTKEEIEQVGEEQEEEEK